MESDDVLVERCLDAKQAAAQAFDELYRRHAPSVLAFVHGLVRGDEHTARDALQETFLRFYTALPSFERGRPVRPWLLRIARNVALDHGKRASTRAEVPHAPEALPAAARGEAPGEVVARREAATLLRAAVLELPAEERAVFLLKHDLGQTYEQVADVLACSVRTAKYRMKAALERLGREAERLGVNA
jgi:RNA polymerase sigma-70 factor (ECF subfamily)